MSGFAGFTNYTYRRDNTELVLKNMTDSIAKRGVDVEAYYDDRYTHIGYRSRAIKNMELKKKAMSFARMDNEYIVVWDGELLNKQDLIQNEGIEIETNEDEEVILKLYDKLGEKFVEKIQGFFSFAIWNKGKQTLYLARDYLGIKPLFYHIKDSNFIFASEIKAILQFPDVKACLTDFGIASMFLKGVVPLKLKPFFKGIEELGAGEYLVYKPSQMRIEKYNGNPVKKVANPVIRSVEKNIVLTNDEIKNIVKIKDMPSNISYDVMLVRECEKIASEFETSDFSKFEKNWESFYEYRKKLLSPSLKIDLDDFYHFQRNKEYDESDFCSIDRIANRFGYHILSPKLNSIIDEANLRNMLKEMVEDSNSPILEIIQRDAAREIMHVLDIDTISYLIEINIWMEEYEIKIE